MTISEFEDMYETLLGMSGGEEVTIILDDTWGQCNSIGLAVMISGLPRHIHMGHISEKTGDVYMYFR